MVAGSRKSFCVSGMLHVHSWLLTSIDYERSLPAVGLFDPSLVCVLASFLVTLLKESSGFVAVHPHKASDLHSIANTNYTNIIGNFTCIF